MELQDKENIAGTHNDGPDDSVTSNELVAVSYDELSEHAQQLDEHMSDVEQGVAALGTLCDMSEKLGTEPVSQPALEAIEIAVKHLVTSIGGDAAMVAFEAYQVVGKPNVQMAFESISELVKKIWEKLVAGFKWAVAWSEKFLESMFSAAGQLRRRAVQMRDVLKKKHNTGGLAGDEMLTSKELASFFTRREEKQAMRPTEVVQAYADTCKLMDNLGKASTSYAENAAKVLKETYTAYGELVKESKNAAMANFDHFLQTHILPAFVDERVFSQIPGVRKASFSDRFMTILGLTKTGPYNDVWMTELPIERAAFYGIVVGKDTPAEKVFDSLMRCGWGFKQQHYSKENDSIGALTSEEAIKVCYLVEQRMGEIMQMGTSMKVLKNALQETTQGARKFSANPDISSEERMVLRYSAEIGNLLTRVATQSEHQARMFEISAAEKMLKYIKISVPSMGTVAA